MKSFLKCREGKRAVSIRKHVLMSIKTCRGIKKCISGMERYMDKRIRSRGQDIRAASCFCP